MFLLEIMVHLFFHIDNLFVFLPFHYYMLLNIIMSHLREKYLALMKLIYDIYN